MPFPSGEASAVRARRALQLVEEAQALPPEGRDAHVRRGAADDPQLLRDALDLLAKVHDEEGRHGGFFGPSVVAFAEPVVAAVQRGEERSRERAVAEVQQALAGRYELESEVGRGGSAVVFRARDCRHPRPVAVKIVLLTGAGEATERRFSQEIAIVAALQHPYIVPLLDSGRTDSALYCVMHFVAGKTLRHRLHHDQVLTADVAVSFAADIAEALDAAHSRGVVHRDIKPSNILLDGTHALLTDFGIALATEGDATRLTATGMVVGTPHYMSPEQAAGDRVLDGRSDVYSLGCVVYEMLAGEVPFPGASVHAVRAKHLHAAIPDVIVLRPSLPTAMQPVLARALAKAPADRFPTAGEFVAALRQAATVLPAPATGGADTTRPSPPLVSTRATSRWSSPHRRNAARLASVLALVLLAVGARIVWQRLVHPTAGTPLDALAVVVFPLERLGAVPAEFNDREQLRDALREWRDLRVVDAPSLAEALGGQDGATLTLSAAQRVTRSLGAGLFVRGSVSADQTQVWIRLLLYSADAARVTSEASRRLPLAPADLPRIYRELVHELLFRERVELLSPAVATEGAGTVSYVAYGDFLAGRLAISQWELAAADSAFSRAVKRDRDYAHAWPWLGLVRRWAQRETALWQGAARQAVRGLRAFSARDSLLASALLASAEGETPTACRMLNDLVRRSSGDFAAWYASADCLGRDSVVVRDNRTLTGWRFRSSRHAAVERYRRAFLLMPSVMRGLRQANFNRARSLFQVSASILARGVALPPDTTRFLAYPARAGDSLVLLPLPDAQWKDGSYLETRSPRERAALERAFDDARQGQRRLFREVAAAWVADAPVPEAYETLGIALQWLGDPSALDTLDRARQLAPLLQTRAEIMATTSLVGLLLGAPEDSALLERSVNVADSLLADSSLVAADPRSAVIAAVLTGRGLLAATIAARAPGEPTTGLPTRVRPTAERLFTLSALGGPADSLRTLEARTTAQLRQSGDTNAMVRMMAFRRAGVLTFPNYEMHALALLSPGPDALLEAMQAAHRGDRVRARARLQHLHKLRRDFAREDYTFDGLLPEAELWRQLGEPEEAIRSLDPTLQALPRVTLGLADPAQVGALVRAMALRAELAAQTGDRADARRWARAVVVMWRNCDAHLRPLLDRMRALMS